MILSENKQVDNNNNNIDDCRLICFKSENHHYGTGFIVSSKWKNNIYKHWKLSDRISVLQLQTQESPKYPRYIKIKQRGLKLKLRKRDDKGLITIVNLYAPTAELQGKNPNEIDNIYIIP